MAAEGVTILVRLNNKDAEWHERLLLAELPDGSWAVATPDEDIEILDLTAAKFRMMGKQRRLPVGIREDQCHLVYKPGQKGEYWTVSEVNELKEEAKRFVKAKTQRKTRAPSQGSSGQSSGAGGSRARLRSKTPPVDAGLGIRVRLKSKSSPAKALAPAESPPARARVPAAASPANEGEPECEEEGDDDEGSVKGTDEPTFPQLPVLQPQPAPPQQTRPAASW